MEKIAIVGGGASGLVAAIAAKTKMNEVIILEKNDSCGKKILVTGNGRCNYWNTDQSISHYHSEDEELIKDFITETNCQMVIDFFAYLGIIPKIKNGYYYPSSNQALSIKNALLSLVKEKNIIIKENILVESISYEKEKFVISYGDNKLIVDKVIIATGTKASQKINTKNNGYELVKQLGHTLIEPLPALVQLQGSKKYLKKWNGVRTDVKIILEEDNKKIAQEEGEIQLTDYGISGICTFNLSYYVAKGLKKGKKEVVKINFLPFIKQESLKDYFLWMEKRVQKIQKVSIKENLELLLNYKLVEVILEISNIKKDLTWQELNNYQKEQLIKNLVAFELEIIKTNPIERAQVCSGGVPLKELNLKTMESKILKNLYLTGELIDIVGDCGGYNLSIAWISGLLAGIDIKRSKYD